MNLTTRQYARLVSEWISSIGLDPLQFGTHSLRRTKATLIYKRTGNLRAVQLLLGHTKIESTVRYLGIEVDDAPPWRNKLTSELPGRSRYALPDLDRKGRVTSKLWCGAASGSASSRSTNNLGISHQFPRAARKRGACASFPKNPLDRIQTQLVLTGGMIEIDDSRIGSSMSARSNDASSGSGNKLKPSRRARATIVAF